MHLSKRSLFVGLIVLLASISNAFADFDFPKKLGIYERGDRTDYGEGLGYSYAYNYKGTWATVYVYDMGHKDIPAGTKSPIIAQAFEEAIAEVKQAGEAGMYRNVKMATLPHHLDTLKSDFLSAKITFIYAAQPGMSIPMDSYIFCRGQDGKILKVRASGKNTVDFSSELLKFMQELQEHLG